MCFLFIKISELGHEAPLFLISTENEAHNPDLFLNVGRKYQTTNPNLHYCASGSLKSCQLLLRFKKTKKRERKKRIVACVGCFFDCFVFSYGLSLYNTSNEVQDSLVQNVNRATYYVYEIKLKKLT